MVRAEGEAKDLLRNIRLSMRSVKLKDPVAKAAAALRKDKQRGQLCRSEWDFEGEDILLFNGRIYVPDAADLRRKSLHNIMIPLLQDTLDSGRLSS